jgi:hypothetical protein
VNDGFDALAKCAGEWVGRNRVQPCVEDSIEESASRIVITPVLGGTFLRLDQAWAWKDQPQSGSMVIGYLPQEDVATVHWIDTWHNGRRSMNLVGRFEPHGKLVASGHFAVESGPDWGWRIEIQTEGAGNLRMNMFCINPASGAEEGWVWSTFNRQSV